MVEKRAPAPWKIRDSSYRLLDIKPFRENIFKCAAVEGKPNKVRYIAYMTKYEMLTSNLKKTNIMQLDPCQKWLNRNTNINILF